MCWLPVCSSRVLFLSARPFAAQADCRHFCCTETEIFALMSRVSAHFACSLVLFGRKISWKERAREKFSRCEPRWQQRAEREKLFIACAVIAKANSSSCIMREYTRELPAKATHPFRYESIDVNTLALLLPQCVAHCMQESQDMCDKLSRSTLSKSFRKYLML